MNRYDIRDKESNLITHSYTAESPMDIQPEWGTPEHQEQAQNPDGTPAFDAQGNPVMVDVPSAFDILVTDITNTKSDPRWKALRSERDRRIAACDWTQLADAPATVNKVAWATYRQQLRDLPDQPGVDPSNPIWPVPPS